MTPDTFTYTDQDGAVCGFAGPDPALRFRMSLMSAVFSALDSCGLVGTSLERTVGVDLGTLQRLRSTRWEDADLDVLLRVAHRLDVPVTVG